MNDTFTSMYVTGQHKNKQISDKLEYIITHLHQHTWSIHNSYVSKMCIQNIANIFAGFWIRACWKTAKSAKINVPRIFPRLQYLIKCPKSKKKITWPFITVPHTIFCVGIEYFDWRERHQFFCHKFLRTTLKLWTIFFIENLLGECNITSSCVLFICFSHFS